MGLGLEVERSRLTPAAFLAIGTLVGAVGHVIGEQIGQLGQSRAEVLVELLQASLAVLQAFLQSAHPRDQLLRRSPVRTALAADLARDAIALGLLLLHPRLEGALLLVDGQDRGGHGWRAAPDHGVVERLGIVPQSSQVMHGWRLSDSLPLE